MAASLVPEAIAASASAPRMAVTVVPMFAPRV